jgi:tetratricopeptide (TPR) repeat protein
VFRSPDPTAPNNVRAMCRALIVLALVAVASACGGGSSSNGVKNPDATFKAALQLQKQGKLSAAAQLYQQVITAEPNNVFARYDLGVVDQASNDPVGALQAYGEALTINPKYVPALYNEATIYATTDPISAISLYRQIVALQPTAPTAYLNLGLLEIKHGAPKQGVSDLTTAVKQDGTLLATLPKHLQGLVSALASPAPPSTSPTSPATKHSHGASSTSSTSPTATPS